MALQAVPEGSALTTTGQVDWVGLSRLPVTVSLETVKRLSHAGVELLTVGVGNAICSAFSFPPEGQQELFSSLSALKGTSTLSDVLYFGFGVKHIVRTLSETEQGATLVALCAAMAVPYQPFRVARIIRELASQTGAPGDLVPSIQQWSKLIETCTNALLKSHFHVTFYHFARLLDDRHNAICKPAAPEEVARALFGLARLSKGLIDAALFTGGLDCALLAAVAHCLLRLSIEIRDENQSLLFSNTNKTMPHAIFMRFKPGNQTASANSLVQHIFFLSSGDELLKPSDHAFCFPTRWHTIFQDSFPEWSEFSNPRLSLLLRNAIASSLHTTREIWTNLDIDSFIMRYPGLDLALHAATIFPELSYLFDALDSSQHEDPQYSTKPYAIIGSHCRCVQCTPRGANNFRYCLISIACTVAHLAVWLGSVRLHPDIPPRIDAIIRFYSECHKFARNETMSTVKIERELQVHGMDRLLNFFAGTTRVIRPHSRPDLCAISAHGVCISSTLLRRVDGAVGDTFSPEITPGAIQFRGHSYSWLENLQLRVPQNIKVIDMSSWKAPSQLSHYLVVEETEDPSCLAASYRVEEMGAIEYLGFKEAQALIMRCLHGVGVRTIGALEKDIIDDSLVAKIAKGWKMCGPRLPPCSRLPDRGVEWVVTLVTRSECDFTIHLYPSLGAIVDCILIRRMAIEDQRSNRPKLVKTCTCTSCISEWAFDIVSRSVERQVATTTQRTGNTYNVRIVSHLFEEVQVQEIMFESKPDYKTKGGQNGRDRSDNEEVPPLE